MKICIINIIILCCFASILLAGGPPEQLAYPNQSVEIEIKNESNIYLEIGQWVGGFLSLVFVTWFSFWLKNRRKKNIEVKFK